MEKSSSAAAAAPQRLLFIDNLRWLMIVLVITIHAAVTYSGVGGWYCYERTKLSPATFLFFVTYESWLQAFFMGFLFFLAGYFVPGKFDRKGARVFLKDRAFRLGVPSLLYLFVIGPATIYWLLVVPAGTRDSFAGWWVDYVFGLRVLQHGTGPLWFCVALLIFCAVYAGIRAVSGRVPSNDKRMPRNAHVVAAILAMGAATFLVRIVWPIGTSVYNMQLCFFADYIVLFAAGIHAARHGWLTSMPRRFGLRWLAISLFGAGAAWFAIILSAVATKRSFDPYNGGLHWQSAAVAMWEAWFAAGVCLGLIVIFRDAFNAQGPLARFFSDNAFAVYVLHPPVLIGATLLLSHWAAPPIAKFATVSAIGVVVTFSLAAAVRTVPAVRRVL